MGQNTVAVSEKAFQQQVVDLARLFGWMEYHTWNSMHSRKGFPDLVLLRKPRLIFAELKSTKGKVSVEQQQWIDALRYVGMETYVWWPKDWERIVSTLRKP